MRFHEFATSIFVGFTPFCSATIGSPVRPPKRCRQSPSPQAVQDLSPNSVVIYDRIRENVRRFKQMPVETLLNRSLDDPLPLEESEQPFERQSQ